MSKQKYVFWEITLEGVAVSQGTLISVLKICFIFLLPSQKIVHSKFHSLIPLKRKSPFMRYLFIEYQSGKWSADFQY